jgi:23S rRNA pseudouridine1911/1915/1917 synthase
VVPNAKQKDLDHVAEGAPRPLDRVLRDADPAEPWSRLRRAIWSGKVRVNDRVVTDASARVEAGDRVTVTWSAPRVSRREHMLGPSAIVYVDADVVVVDKPAGISTIEHENEPTSLDALVASWLRKRQPASARAPLGIVHRLDKETSGLLVFARTLVAKRELKQEFRFHSVARRYLGVAHGAVRSQTISSRLVADRGDGLRGSTENPKLGRPAITHVRTVSVGTDASLIECRLETGRTHQIRIHLFEAGHPLVGERVYLRHFQAPRSERSLLAAPRLMLHAAELGFRHPRHGSELRFQSQPPEDFRQVAERLGLRLPQF